MTSWLLWAYAHGAVLIIGMYIGRAWQRRDDRKAMAFWEQDALRRAREYVERHGG